jgi:Flp pilus assembly pilin Flp
MRRDLKKFVRDQRGAAMPEYALLLFAVLLSGAAASKRLGARVYAAGDLTRRELSGEDIQVQGNIGTASGGTAMARSTSIGASNGTSAASSSNGGSGTSSNGGGSSGAVSGGGVVLGASGSASVGGGSGAVAGGGGGGSSIGSSGASSSGGGSGMGLGPQTTDAFIASNTASNANNAPSTGGSAPASAPAMASNAASQTAATSDATPRGFLGGTGAPPMSSGSGSGATSQNTVNPAPSSSGTGGVNGDGYTISAAGEQQMQALAAQAKANADGKRPLGQCYHVVKTDIDEVGYGDLAKTGNTAFPKQIPSSDQEYAHQFADYMNATAANGHTNADNLGLQKLPITNPYDAPPGSIIVVRAGTPGTRNPVAGDIVVAGGGGKFYNDGNMGYGGSKNFPAGNNYVLGIYAPK